MCPLIVRSSNRKQSFDLPSEGPHPANLVKVKDLGEVETKFEPKHRVRLIWKLKDEVNANRNPLFATQSFNLSFDPKSQLYKAVKQILGCAPPPEFDLETLVGTEALVVIEHNVGADGETYANIAAVVRQPRKGNADGLR